MCLKMNSLVSEIGSSKNLLIPPSTIIFLLSYQTFSNFKKICYPCWLKPLAVLFME
jgi:hypothetical protein